MDTSEHNLPSLFQQLGLDSDAGAIEAFIEAHSPLPKDVRLAEAPFWNASQSAFLKEAIKEDADWAEIVDELDTQLRQ